MIQLTRLNGREILLNADHIEMVEVTPDTIVTLTNGHKYLVTETLDGVRQRIVAFRRECALPADWEK